jgi:hypothetical protein
LLRDLQTKLTVNEPGDQYEQEADRVAEHVMRMPDTPLRLQRKCGCGDGPAAVGSCRDCASPPVQLQRRAAPENSSMAATTASVVSDVVGSPGQTLDKNTRAFFEQRFKQDFGDVRVHSDDRAAKSAQSVNALAYTVGNHIVLGSGKYRPEAVDGKKLLAHELTHVVQQKPQATSRPGGNERNNTHDPLRGGVNDAARSPLMVGQSPMAIQRKVDVAAGTAVFKITQEPGTTMEIKNLLGKWRAKPTTATAIKFEGSANATCGTDDSSKGYELGIVQVETKEVNNAKYRGAAKTDGSAWLRHDIPAVRPPGPCLDSSYRNFWHNPVALICGSTASTSYSDWPGDMYDTIVRNKLTGKPNYLTELHVGLDFITALVLRIPGDSLQVLRWASWDVAWDYTFDTPTSGESKILKGLTSSGTGQFVESVPSPPELPTKYAVPAKNCNTLTFEASDNPAGIQASKTW